MDIFFQRIDTEDLNTPSLKEEQSPIPSTTLAVLVCGMVTTSILLDHDFNIRERSKLMRHQETLGQHFSVGSWQVSRFKKVLLPYQRFKNITNLATLRPTFAPPVQDLA